MTAGNWTHWALDVSLSEPCFVPLELDSGGNIESIVYGTSLFAETPPGKLIAVVSQKGQDDVEEWCSSHPEEITRLFPVAATPKGEQTDE